MSLRKFEFDIVLPADTTLAIYEGRVRYVIVTSREGLRLQIPATNLMPYVSDDGINGRFTMLLDENDKLVELTRL